MRFVKFHGYGNDYLVFEAAELKGAGLSPGFEPVGAGPTGGPGAGVQTLGRTVARAARLPPGDEPRTV